MRRLSSPVRLTGWLILLFIALSPVLAEAMLLEQPLTRFMGDRDELSRLRGSETFFDVSVPLPARWQARELTLNLVYRNSISLLRDHSQLRVELNGLVIAQFALDPNRPEGRAAIRLPLDLLQPGYNALRFAVAQHTVIGLCEDPTAPELWTHVDTQQSTLRLEYERLPVAARLSQLDEIFDRRYWQDAAVHIAMAPEPLDVDQLRWGALAAQAAALRLENVPTSVQLSQLRRAPDDREAASGRFPLLDYANLGSSDLILVGARDQLAPFLGTQWASDVTEGYLAVFPRDDDPSLALLVISGRDEAEVTRAATVLSLINIPFPDASRVLVSALAIPPALPDSGPRRLPLGISASFAQLGVETTTLLSPLQPAHFMSGAGTALLELNQVNAARKSLVVEFWAPAGLYAGDGAHAVLRLHLGYGAGLRPDSALNLLVNGVFVRGIALDDPKGATFVDYEVRIPLSLLQAGRNQLALIAMMAPSETDFCALRQGENLLLTVYRDSSLRLPSAGQFARLPDLRMLVRSGFPFLRDPWGGELAVRVMGKAPESIAAAWTLLGRLAQITTMPLPEALIGFTVDAHDRELIAVGPLGELDPELAQAAPAMLTDPAWVNYVMLHAITDPQPADSGLERWLAHIEGWFEPRSGQVQTVTARARFHGELLDRYGALLAFESPAQPGRSVLLLTAREPALLLHRASQLIQPDYWYNMQGALTLWDERKESLRWQEPETRYTVGRGSINHRLTYYFDHYPWALLATSLTLFVGLALLLLWMLRRFKRRHHPEIDHEG